MKQTILVQPEDCPEPFWHETHRYCPACSWVWKEPQDPLKYIGEVHVGDQFGCARCGADEHKQLAYQPFTHNIDMGDGFIATHYAPCPTNGEPILFCQGPKPE